MFWSPGHTAKTLSVHQAAHLLGAPAASPALKNIPWANRPHLSTGGGALALLLFLCELGKHRIPRTQCKPPDPVASNSHISLVKIVKDHYSLLSKAIPRLRRPSYHNSREKLTEYALLRIGKGLLSQVMTSRTLGTVISGY